MRNNMLRKKGGAQAYLDTGPNGTGLEWRNFGSMENLPSIFGY